MRYPEGGLVRFLAEIGETIDVVLPVAVVGVALQALRSAEPSWRVRAFRMAANLTFALLFAPEVGQLVQFAAKTSGAQLSEIKALVVGAFLSGYAGEEIVQRILARFRRTEPAGPKGKPSDPNKDPSS